jgi:hypothetical protein
MKLSTLAICVAAFSLLAGSTAVVLKYGRQFPIERYFALIPGQSPPQIPSATWADPESAPPQEPSVQQEASSVVEAPSQGDQPAPSGTMPIKGESRIGCASEDRYERLLTFASRNDDEAFKREFLTGVLSSDCTSFTQGEPVYPSGSAGFGRTKVRRPGETTEYITAVETLY